MAVQRPEDLTALLAEIVDDHVPPGDEREAAARCCLDAVEFARAFGGGGAGARARRSAALLLELDCPALTRTTRLELAVACELIVLGALVREDSPE